MAAEESPTLLGFAKFRFVGEVICAAKKAGRGSRKIIPFGQIGFTRQAQRR
jgi:hypothetical protein